MKALIRIIIVMVSATLTASAQGKWTKVAKRAVVTLNAVQATGDTVRTRAFFLEDDGTLIAPMRPLQRATTAWATDEKGQRYEVTRIAGFNATYDVARLRVSNAPKVGLRLTKDGMTEGEACFILASDLTEDKVVKKEKAGAYDYLTLSARADRELAGLPLMNATGEVVGMVQTPVLAKNSPLFALDARFAVALRVGAMDANNADLRQCGIMKALPEEEAQAKSFIYLCQGNVALRIAYAEDFIKAYPQSPSGWVQKAECQAEAEDFEGALATYTAALKARMAERHEIFYSRAQMIYNAVVGGKATSEAMTLTQALDDVRTAFAQSSLPVYSLLEARILYAQKEYSAAAEGFMALTQTNMRAPELFVYAAQCREQMGAQTEEILALQDSALACFSRPYPTEVANYLWLRAMTRRSLERWREAVSDLNDYEHLVGSLLTDAFYFEREQLEIRTRMFSQALADIQTAIRLNPTEPVYHAEMAVILYRVGETEEAIKACKRAIELDGDYEEARQLLDVLTKERQ